MNRQRGLAGRDGYEANLGFDPVDTLRQLAGPRSVPRWLDMCCGEGHALLEASRVIDAENLRAELVGVDLVGPSKSATADAELVEFHRTSLADWQPEHRFELITCVHGLHYIGDKLGLIAKAASWLTTDGLMSANLDLANVKISGVAFAARSVARMLRQQGFEYNSRTRRLRRAGSGDVRFPLVYLGADDQAGPNSTHQPAVDSYYKHLIAPSPDRCG